MNEIVNILYTDVNLYNKLNNYSNDSTQIVSSLDFTNEIRQISNFGIIQHYSNTISIGNTSIDINETNIENNSLFILLKEKVLKYNIQNIDIIACNLLPTWNKTIDLLGNKLGVTIRASSSIIGHSKYGGKWILERLSYNKTKITYLWNGELFDSYFL